MLHCVRLGILHEIESRFTLIGLRMKKIWPSEVSVKISPEFKNSDSKFKNRHPEWAGKFQPRAQVNTRVNLGVDLGVDLGKQVDTRVDLPPSFPDL